MKNEADFIELHVLARCYAQKLPLPEMLYVDGKNLTPAQHLENLAANGRDPCPAEIARMLSFVETRCSVSTAAAGLLGRFRQLGRLPDGREKAPVPVLALDEVDALRQLARIYRAERTPAAEVRVRGQIVATAVFLSSLASNRGECPSSITADVGLAHQPATMAEVAMSLLGRLRQRGAL